MPVRVRQVAREKGLFEIIFYPFEEANGTLELQVGATWRKTFSVVPRAVFKVGDRADLISLAPFIELFFLTIQEAQGMLGNENEVVLNSIFLTIQEAQGIKKQLGNENEVVLNSSIKRKRRMKKKRRTGKVKVKVKKTRAATQCLSISSN